jgi:hypothetical protein
MMTRLFTWGPIQFQTAMQLAFSARLSTAARPRAVRCVCEQQAPIADTKKRSRVLDANYWPRQTAFAQQQRRSLLELVSAAVEVNVRPLATSCPWATQL